MMLKSALCPLCLIFFWLTILCTEVATNPVSRAATPGGIPNVTLSARVSFISDLQCQKELVCRVDADNRALQRVLDISIVEKVTNTVLKRVASIYYLTGTDFPHGDTVETRSGVVRVNGSLMVHKVLTPNKGFGDEDFVCKIVYVNWDLRIIKSVESDVVERTENSVCRVPDVLTKLDSLDKKFSRFPVVEAKGNVCIVPDLEDAMAKLLANLSDITDKKLNVVSHKFANQSDVSKQLDALESNLSHLSKLDVIERHLNNQSIETKLKSQSDVLKKLVVIEEKINGQSNMEKKLNDIERRLKNLSDVDKKLNVIETKMGSLRDDVLNLTSHLPTSSDPASQPSATNGNFSKECGQISSCDSLRDLGKGHTIQSRQIITWPNGVKVLCDTETDAGGWTIFQRRFNGLVNFYRTWREYENGFGDLEGEFWMGLKYLQRLVETDDYEMRVDMRIQNGSAYFAQYSTFKLAHPCSKYMLTVGGYTGNVDYDSMSYHNGKKFSTFNSDNDLGSSNYAKDRASGWWFGQCCHSDLNILWRSEEPKGIYFHRVVPGLDWITFSELKVRRRRRE